LEWPASATQRQQRQLEIGEAKQSDKHELRISNGAGGWKPIAVEGTIHGDDAHLK
jgi:hypothetical protein